MTTTLMTQEARQAPQIVANQWQQNRNRIIELTKHLQATPPPFAMTIARGSSDNAATFAKYLLESRLGLVTASAAPSIVTLYGQKLQLQQALVIGISQSGESQDICEVMQLARKQGAITVALINNTQSTLAKTAQYIIPLWAGDEQAVAATKSYIASLSALIQLLAYYQDDKTLIACGETLPQALQDALQCDWQALLQALDTANDLLVLARGYGLPIAQEMALKLKETMSLHAEALSNADVLHGPLALVKRNDPIFMLATGNNLAMTALKLIEKLKTIGARIILASHKNQRQLKLLAANAIRLPLPPSIDPICDPLLAIQVFYPVVAQLAINRGYNPDAPQHLQKVTTTR